ncbi:hypothetical protein CHGG_08136 [Chaetomium globosum CBS 148.51]|uniref:Biogenesis of lysosome-related organelles complex 1 subunit KXD1 n=1 Tax=Chaetomium globosum (strain ATCC 6205 / CBS 148.51 / DSM 1962 / NBRC 6347 / NRRL 1970) TaxID=306901 RepID=Q2GV68_CHAGB|nr:uncharacterized protein CHGG_08136 [Chaetomium globosum CBS 148.51]EAQ86883.1 hypothetical protein CHGG_08136 [Chaetomium globosum CBS 148.51]
MTSTYAPQYYASGAVPIPPSKPQYQNPATGYYPSGESTYSVSPPEEIDPSVVSSASGYGNSYSVTTSYAGSSQGEYDSSAGSAAGVDLNEYMQERFAATFDPLALDKCTAKQAQTSGHLNAKHRELLELQAKAQARLAKSRARFAQGLEDAREVREDLEWTQKKVASLKAKASKKHSKEYAKARARYPSPDLY